MKKTNIIKLRFVRDGEPRGREYTYYTPEEVEPGELVAIEAKADGTTKGIITQINVPEEEIAPFKDRAKTIIGKLDPEEEQKCRVCGCTWTNGCSAGCYWVEEDLCNECVGKEKIDKEALRNE